MAFTGKATFSAGRTCRNWSKTFRTSSASSPPRDGAPEPSGRRQTRAQHHPRVDRGHPPPQHRHDQPDHLHPQRAGRHERDGLQRRAVQGRRPGASRRRARSCSSPALRGTFSPSCAVRFDQRQQPQQRAETVHPGQRGLGRRRPPATQFTTRVRRRNYTQIFTAGVEVSGSMRRPDRRRRRRGRLPEAGTPARTAARPGELRHQRRRAAATQQGSSTVRRTMNGIIPSLATHVYTPNVGPIPIGSGRGRQQADRDHPQHRPPTRLGAEQPGRSTPSSSPACRSATQRVRRDLPRVRAHRQAVPDGRERVRERLRRLQDRDLAMDARRQHPPARFLSHRRPPAHGTFLPLQTSCLHRRQRGRHGAGRYTLELKNENGG